MQQIAVCTTGNAQNTSVATNDQTLSSGAVAYNRAGFCQACRIVGPLAIDSIPIGPSLIKDTTPAITLQRGITITAPYVVAYQEFTSPTATFPSNVYVAGVSGANFPVWIGTSSHGRAAPALSMDIENRYFLTSTSIDPKQLGIRGHLGQL